MTSDLTSECFYVVDRHAISWELDRQRPHVHASRSRPGRGINITIVTMCLLNIFRHSDQLIERLENAGLGYHVDADKTVDKLGKAG